jgi:hypothetical protein
MVERIEAQADLAFCLLFRSLPDRFLECIFLE